MNEEHLFIKRNQLKQELVTYLINDSAITGVYLGGSLAEGKEDAYSDIDLRVVVKQDSNKKLKITELIENRDDILFIESFYNSYAVVHFFNFIKLDLFVYYQSELEPSIWLKNIKILKDNTGYLEEIKTESKLISYRPSQQEFELIINKYLAHLHETYRRYQRSEYNYLHHSCLTMKHCLASLYYIEKGEVPNSLGDWSKYEGDRSKLTDVEQHLLQEFTPVNLKELSGFTPKLNAEVNSIANKISKKYNLYFNQKTFSDACDLVNFN